MHLGKFHSAIDQIVEEIASLNLAGQLDALFNALQQYVSSPNDQTSLQFKQQLDTLQGILLKASSNNASPTFRETLDQIGASQFLGRGLLEEIQHILQANNVTPAHALSQLGALKDRVNKFSGMVTGIKNSFSELKIEIDQLEPGKCELGIVLPRAAVGETLGKLAYEFATLNKFFSGISELVGEGIEGAKIRTISATDWQIFLDQAPATLAAVIFAIERIVALFKSMLEIRKLKKDLQSHELSPDIMKQIDDEIDKKVKFGIEGIVEQLVKQHSKIAEPGRLNELKVQIRIGLYQVAKRINEGATVEARARPPNPPDIQKPEHGASQEEMSQYNQLIEQHQQATTLTEEINAAGLRIGMQTLTLGEEEQPLINYDMQVEGIPQPQPALGDANSPQ